MPEEAQEADAGPTARLNVIRFHYIKGQFFRTIHMDGAYGGITPHGYIHAAVYSERRVLPQITEQPINLDGSLGDERATQSKEHVTRELEADLLRCPDSQERGELAATESR